jgi:hypothetical protein
MNLDRMAFYIRFLNTSISALASKVINQATNEGKRRPSLVARLMLVGAVQGASAFLIILIFDQTTILSQGKRQCSEFSKEKQP